MSEPVLLYDGLCGLCDGSVQFVLRHDRRGVMRFATLQGDFARGVLARHPGLAGVDSLMLVETDPATGEERVATRSTGVLRIARYLGGPWPALAGAFSVVPRFLRDAAYDLVARTRFRLFGRLDRCRVPEPAQRARFLEWPAHGA
jgi:predicted DCC family thiol-disulfide oxidoreductase YuxK